MGRNSHLRLLIIDDLRLVAKCVDSRIRSAAAESGFSHRQPAFIDWMSITSLRRDETVKSIGDRILRDDINFLIVDRGILDHVDERGGQSSAGATYVREASPEYTDIIEILAELGQRSKRCIKGIIIYTLDHPDRGNPWFVDKHKITQQLRAIFGKDIVVDIIKTHAEVYQATGLSLFYPSATEAGVEEARGADLQLYGAIVGEMVWRSLGNILFANDVRDRLRLVQWFRRNYLIFLGATCGLGIGVSAIYDLLRPAFSNSWAMLAIGIAMGVIAPLGLLAREPRLLMPPSSE